MIHFRRFQIKTLIPLFIGVLVFGAGIFFSDELFAFSSTIASPVFGMREEVFVSGVRSSSMEKETQALKGTLSLDLQIARLKIDMLRAQNSALLDVLRRNDQDRALVIARIFSRPPATLYDVFVVDVGGREGVKSGDPVYVRGNIAVGEVLKSSWSSSQVSLFSSSGEKTDVLVGPDAVQAVLVGVGGGNFKINFPRGVPIENGSKVFLLKQPETLVGTVEYALKEKNETFQTLYVTSPVDVFSLRYLQIGV